MPASNVYEPILRELSSTELHAIIDALSDVRTTDEGEHLCVEIVRELSVREAYERASHRRHPAGGNHAAS